MNPAAILLAIALAGCAVGTPPVETASKGTKEMHEAKGTFTVAMTPEVQGGVSRMALAKTFEGGMKGTSTGTMLSAGNPASGSAGYVAIEAFTGTLDGRPGGFALQHSGTMDAGSQALSIAIVPGSGTGALVGLSGAMEIAIAGGVHSYTLRYRLLSR